MVGLVKPCDPKCGMWDEIEIEERDGRRRTTLLWEVVVDSQVFCCCYVPLYEMGRPAGINATHSWLQSQ